MIPLAEASIPPAPARPEPTADTAADFDEALTFSGLPTLEIRAVIVVGAHASAGIARILGECPHARVLLLAPAPGLLAALASADPGVRDRCFVAGLPAEPGAGYRTAVLAELVQFLSEAEVGPSGALLLGPPDEAPAPAYAIAADFVSGFSAGLFAELGPELDRGAEAALALRPLLRAIGDFLFESRDLYHALKYYWSSYHAAGAAGETDGQLSRHAGWRILTCFAELGSPEWVERWLAQPIFEPDFRGKVAAELGPAPEASRRARAETEARNLEALARFPAAVAALRAAPRREVALVFLPGVPWRLRYDGTSLQVEADDYPLAVIVAGPILVEVNPPPARDDLRLIVATVRGKEQPHAAVLGWSRHAWAAEMLLRAEIVPNMPGWKRVVFLLERDASALLALLGAIDVAPLVAPGQGPPIQLLVAPDAPAALIALLGAEADLPPPRVLVGDDDAALEAAIKAVHGHRIVVADANRARLESLLGRAQLDETCAALAGGRPLRILLVTTLYSDVVQHVALDLAAGFEALGHQATVLREREPGRMIHYQNVTEALLAVKPDFLVLINHTRAEAARFYPTHLPIVTWIQDELPPLKDPALIKTLGPLDFAYAFSSSVQLGFQRLGYPFVGHLPFATNLTGSEAEIPPAHAVRDEVVYATHVVLPPEPAATPGFIARMFLRLSRLDAVHPSLDWVEYHVDGVLRRGLKLIDKIDAEAKREAQFAALMLARVVDRMLVARTLLKAGIPLALYGKGWSAHPEFAPHHRGLAQPGEPLRKIFREHKVVLHINRGCNVHPRLLEGFAAGGFVLGRYDGGDELPGETADQFALGKELFLYRDDAELVTLVRRAFSDEPWRRGVIEAARARIARDHTFASRAQVILRDLHAGLTRFLT